MSEAGRPTTAALQPATSYRPGSALRPSSGFRPSSAARRPATLSAGRPSSASKEKSKRRPASSGVHIFSLGSLQNVLMHTEQYCVNLSDVTWHSDKQGQCMVCSPFTPFTLYQTVCNMQHYVCGGLLSVFRDQSLASCKVLRITVANSCLLCFHCDLPCGGEVTWMTGEEGLVIWHEHNHCLFFVTSRGELSRF